MTATAPSRPQDRVLCQECLGAADVVYVLGRNGVAFTVRAFCSYHDQRPGTEAGWREMGPEEYEVWTVLRS